MTTSQASDDILEKVYEHWRNLKLDVESIPGGLGGQVRRLSASLGIAPEIAAVLVCSYVGALAGPAWSIRNPHGYTLPVSLNVVLVTDSPILLRGGIRALFEPLTRMIQSRIRTSRFEDPAALAEARTQLRTRLLCMQDTVDGIRQPSNPSLSVVDDRYAQARIDEFNNSFRQKDAAEAREKLLAELASIEFNLRPDILAEVLDTTEMMHPEQLSFDASVCHLALAGEPFDVLAATREKTLAQISKLLHASWFGLPMACLLQERTPRTLLSNLWIADLEVAYKALQAEWASTVGLHDTFAFIDVETKDRPAPAEDPDDPALWGRTLQFLWQWRLSGPPSKLRLAEEGASLFSDFVDEVNSIHSSLPPKLKTFALHWPDLAAKLAMLLHLGGHDPEPWKSPSAKKGNEAKPRAMEPPSAEIRAQTVQAALTLTKFIVARHILMMGRQVVTYHTDEVDPDVEKMVHKLRLCQPATKRELYRTYDKQRCEILEPILAKALALGLIQVADRKLIVTEASVSKTRQCQSVSGVSERNSDELHPDTTPTQAPAA